MSENKQSGSSAFAVLLVLGIFAVLVGLGILLASTGDPDDITCGGQRMRPGDTCVSSGPGVTQPDQSYAQKLDESRKARAARPLLLTLLLGGGGVAVLVGLVGRNAQGGATAAPAPRPVATDRATGSTDPAGADRRSLWQRPEQDRLAYAAEALTEAWTALGTAPNRTPGVESSPRDAGDLSMIDLGGIIRPEGRERYYSAATPRLVSKPYLLKTGSPTIHGHKTPGYEWRVHGSKVTLTVTASGEPELRADVVSTRDVTPDGWRSLLRQVEEKKEARERDARERRRARETAETAGAPAAPAGAPVERRAPASSPAPAPTAATSTVPSEVEAATELERAGETDAARLRYQHIIDTGSGAERLTAMSRLAYLVYGEGDHERARSLYRQVAESGDEKQAERARRTLDLIEKWDG